MSEQIILPISLEGEVVIDNKIRKLIGDDWDKIRAGSYIYLPYDRVFRGLCKGEKEVLKAGRYIINGFWADAVGLGKTLQDYRETNNLFAFFSVFLKQFYR